MPAFWFYVAYSFIVDVLYFFFGFAQKIFTLFLLFSMHVSTSLFIKIVSFLFPLLAL